MCSEKVREVAGVLFIYIIEMSVWENFSTYLSYIFPSSFALSLGTFIVMLVKVVLKVTDSYSVFGFITVRRHFSPPTIFVSAAVITK